MITTGSIINGLEQFQQNLLGLVDSLTDPFWRWQPGPREWSIAQCVDHINTVNGLVVPRVEQAVLQGRQLGLMGSGPFRYPLFDRLFVLGLEPRAPVKSRSPKIYRPVSEPTREEARAGFLALHERLIAAARDADGLDLLRIKVASPVSPLLRFSLGTWFDASLAHEQNHFEQALRVKEKAGFPKG